MTHPQVFGQKFTPICRFSTWKTHPFWPHIPSMTQYGSAPPRELTSILVIPGNPQRCNSMTAKRSIQLNVHVLFFLYIGCSCSRKYSIRKLPKVNLHVTKLKILYADCLFLFKNAFYDDTIYKLCLTFTLNECKSPVPFLFINFNFIVFG